MSKPKLPVPPSNLHWALVRRLLLAIPVGLFLGGILINAFDVGTAAAIICGLVLSFAVFLGTISLIGRRRRASFKADGGDPETVGVLLFGAMAPEIVSPGYYSDGGHSGSGGDFGGGGDSGGGGGDGGG